MSILNRPSDGLLSVLLALWKGLLAYGPKSESELLSLVAPSSVVPDGKADLAKKTLSRWKQLGFFSQVNDSVALSPTAAAVAPDDLIGLRATLLRLVLEPQNNPAFETNQDDEASKASDLTRAGAWVLAQDPYSFPAKYKGGVESLQDGQGATPPPFANDTRWAGFAEWAPFLGLGWSVAKIGFVPNPAFAVRWVLESVFAERNELPQAEFLTRLAELLPIVDGGTYRAAVEAEIRRPWREPIPNEISPTLSSALLFLEATGELRLEPRSDAPQRLLVGRSGRELHPVSHFIRVASVP